MQFKLKYYINGVTGLKIIQCLESVFSDEMLTVYGGFDESHWEVAQALEWFS